MNVSSGNLEMQQDNIPEMMFCDILITCLIGHFLLSYRKLQPVESAHFAGTVEHYPVNTTSDRP